MTSIPRSWYLIDCRPESPPILHRKIFSPGFRGRARRISTPNLPAVFLRVWSSTAGKWRVRYTEHEFCVLFEGRVRIESVTGEKHDFRAGDAFVVPAGFEGIWEVTEPCKKWYSISSPRRPSPKSRIQGLEPAAKAARSGRPAAVKQCRGSRRPGFDDTGDLLGLDDQRGDMAMVSPVCRTITPRSKHSRNTSKPRAPGLPARGSSSTAPMRP